MVNRIEDGKKPSFYFNSQLDAVSTEEYNLVHHATWRSYFRRG